MGYITKALHPLLSIVPKVCVVSIHQDGDGCAFEQVGPAVESSHDSEELAVINGVVLLSLGLSTVLYMAYSCMLMVPIRLQVPL